MSSEIAPRLRFARNALTHGRLGLWPANAALGVVATVISHHPVLTWFWTSMAVGSVLAIAHLLIELSPPWCWCGARHWDDEDDDYDDGGGGEGPAEYGRAA